jgi:hypothetical protein
VCAEVVEAADEGEGRPDADDRTAEKAQGGRRSGKRDRVAAPQRSTTRPPGICIAMCITNWTVMNRPIVASPTPYAWLSRVATGPSAARFQPAATPIAMPPAVARTPIPSSLATRASLRHAHIGAA